MTYPSAILIAVLTTVGALAVFTTDPSQFQEEVDKGVPPEVLKANEEGLISLALKGNRNQSIAAIERLGESQKDLAKVVTALGQAGLRKDELVRTASRLSLEKIGQKAVPFVKPLIESDEFNEFQAGCVIMQAVGTGLGDYVPRFKELLSSGEDAKIMSILFSIESMGVEALPLMDQLIELLEHKNFNVQCGVCRAIIPMGAAGKPAQNRLVRLMKEGNISSRSWASIATAAIGLSEEHDVVGLLTEKLSAFTQIEKERAMMALSLLGEKAKAAAPKVKELMDNPKKHSQPMAAYAYWRLTGETAEPIKVLREMLKDSSYKRTALERATAMGPVASPLVKDIVVCLDDEEEDIVELAVIALGKIGKDASGAISSLKKKLSHEDLLIRMAAKESIAEIRKAEEKE